MRLALWALLVLTNAAASLDRQVQAATAAVAVGRAPWPHDEPRDAVFMRHALGEARAALVQGEVPVGCVLVRGERIVARGHNRANALRDATRHAELVAIDALLARSQDGQSDAARTLEGCELFVTCEPCVMCAAAIGMCSVMHGWARARRPVQTTDRRHARQACLA